MNKTSYENQPQALIYIDAWCSGCHTQLSDGTTHEKHRWLRCPNEDCRFFGKRFYPLAVPLVEVDEEGQEE